MGEDYFICHNLHFLIIGFFTVYDERLRPSLSIFGNLGDYL